MEHKDKHTAICPRFVARVDYQGQSAIQCTTWNLLYFNRAERDADYAAACCTDPTLCPLARVPTKTIIRTARQNGKSTPCLWPTTSSYPTVNALKQEMQKNERE